MVDKDPELKAEFAALVAELRAKFAAIPTIKVTVQSLDEHGKPTGKPYSIKSENGVINLGDSVLTKQEFLLLVQAEKIQPGRGFVIDDGWSHDEWGSGSPWPSDTVSYFFSSSVTSGDRTWMTRAMQRMAAGTGMRFRKSTSANWWLEFWHGLCLSKFLRIHKEELSGQDGAATVGKVGCSKLVMDNDHVRHEDDFNHEMGHVFGLLHEHQRSDRDDHVSVSRSGSDSEKIPARKRHWFLWWSWYSDHATTYSTPYDYHSVMHYDWRVGIRLNCTTNSSTETCRTSPDDATWIVYDRNNSEWGDENGNTWFTPWDIYTIKKRYGITPNRRPDYTPAPEYP